MTIKDDHAERHDGRSGDAPLALMGVRRLMAIGAAVLLAALGVILLLASFPLGLTNVWNLGLACLIGAAVVGVYAGHLDAARLTLRQQAHAAATDETRAEHATEVEKAILARLAAATELLEHLDRRGAAVAHRLEDMEVRVTRSDDREAQLAADLEHLRRRAEQLAEAVGDLLGDELREHRRRRRSG